MVKQAQQVNVGEFVNVGDSYLGRVSAVERNPGLPGNVLLQHACGTYELGADDSVDAWTVLPSVACRLPHCIRVEVKKVESGSEWRTFHNGRLLDKGWSAGSERETRQFAKNMLEAMGLIQDGV